jgi:hypothetical protein
MLSQQGAYIMRVALVASFTAPERPYLQQRSEAYNYLVLAADELGQTSAMGDGAMVARFFHEVATFAMSAATVTVGILLMAILIWVIRRTGWGGVLDFVGMLEAWLGLQRSSQLQATVNVEYRDADGALMDLRLFIHATLRNGRGRAFPLHEGIFVDCEPTWIKPGAWVHISVQDNLIGEDLCIQVDFLRDRLFVQSEYRIADVVAKISHARPGDEAAE